MLLEVASLREWHLTKVALEGLYFCVATHMWGKFTQSWEHSGTLAVELTLKQFILSVAHWAGELEQCELWGGRDVWLVLAFQCLDVVLSDYLLHLPAWVEIIFIHEIFCKHFIARNLFIINCTVDQIERISIVILWDLDALLSCLICRLLISAIQLSVGGWLVGIFLTRVAHIKFWGWTSFFIFWLLLES